LTAVRIASEERLRAIGKTARGRSVFPVFSIRERDGERAICPISAATTLIDQHFAFMRRADGTCVSRISPIMENGLNPVFTG
jgi:hypothetical protein